MEYLPLLVFVLVIVGLIAFARRARQKQATVHAQMIDRIGVGTDVMTTSGLHGTVVAKNDDDTVMLSIAPGIEVRWELAALRELAALPEQFRRGHRDIGESGSDIGVESARTVEEDDPQTGRDSR